MKEPIHVFEIAKSTGGAGAYLRWLVNGLDKDRFRVTVACLSTGGAELAAELRQVSGVRAFHLPMVRYFIEPFSDSVLLFRLARIVRREKIDLIHAHVSKPGFLARLAAFGTGIPVIYSPHGFAFHAGSGRLSKAIFAFLERSAARYLTTKIIVVADAERALAQRFRVGRPEQFVTVHSGIDLTPFDKAVDTAAVKASLGVPPESPLVGAVGRLYPPKQPMEMIRAAAVIHIKRPDVHFVWVGDGPLMPQAQAEIARLGLQSIFHLVGHRRDVPAVMRSLTCFVLPTLWEAFPLTVLEAMAAGVPVIASGVDGIPEAVQNRQTGLLIPPGDSQALAGAVLKLLTHPALTAHYGASGRLRVGELFTRQKMVENMMHVYEEIYLQDPTNQ